MFVHLERSDAIVTPVGVARTVVLEVPWVQLTYDKLRVGPGGENLARWDADADVWVLTSPSAQMRNDHPQIQGIYHRHAQHPFSDITITLAEEGEL
jgi:hypothetical protein